MYIGLRSGVPTPSVKPSPPRRTAAPSPCRQPRPPGCRRQPSSPGCRAASSQPRSGRRGRGTRCRRSPPGTTCAAPGSASPGRRPAAWRSSAWPRAPGRRLAGPCATRPQERGLSARRPAGPPPRPAPSPTARAPTSCAERGRVVRRPAETTSPPKKYALVCPVLGCCAPLGHQKYQTPPNNHGSATSTSRFAGLRAMSDHLSPPLG